MDIEFHVPVMLHNAGVARGQETVVVVVGFIIAVVAIAIACHLLSGVCVFCCPSPSFVVVFVDSPRLLLFVVVFLWLFQHHICLSECAQMDKVWILHTMLRALPTDLHAIPTKGLDVQLGRVRPILRERLAEVPSLGEEVEVMEVGLEGSVVGVKFR